MTQKSKFGGALSIGKKAIAKEQAAVPRIETAPAPIPEPVAPPEPEPLYSAEELKQVNAGGLKVAKAIRHHWRLQAHIKGVSIASLIKAVLIEELGLPEGFTADNLSSPSE